MSYLEIAERLLELSSKIFREENSDKVFDFLRGESQILNFLNNKEHNTVFPKDISDELHISPARVALLLRKMEQKRLVNRNKDPKDLRRTLVELTGKGKAEFEKRKNESLSCILFGLNAVGEEDSAQLLRITEKFLASPE